MQIHKTILTVLVSFACFNTLANATTSLDEASTIAKDDLTQSLSELSELRTAIATEKIPLLSSVTELENSVREKQSKVDRLLRIRDNNDLGLNRLQDQVKALNEQNDYAASLLDEFVRTFETRIDFSETQLYKDSIEEARLILDDSDADQSERFQKQIAVISVALDRLDQLVGGYRYEAVSYTHLTLPTTVIV